jgi:FKBP-type peptidyl-prolyl cis-trans isomerase SlyD
MSTKRRGRRAAVPGFQAGPGTVVAMAYELFDGEGEHVEASDPAVPLVLLVGYGEAVPALERALSGLTQGESADVKLSPEEAFGKRELDAIIEEDRADFPADIAPGDELEADRADGGGVLLKVLEVTDDVIVLDTNHPLAGQTVRLRITITAVRPATADEIARATDRLMQDSAVVSGPLLPAERLLRRGRSESPRDRDEPLPPTPGRVA